MIGIKDMEMPKGCATCPITDKICAAFALDKELKRNDLKISRHPLCPLVDLGSEDMSWEELKELAKDKIVFEHTIFKHFRISNKQCTMSFYKGGDIYFTNKDVKYEDIKIFEDKKPFQMWQIINALTGENK